MFVVCVCDMSNEMTQMSNEMVNHPFYLFNLWRAENHNNAAIFLEAHQGQKSLAI